MFAMTLPAALKAPDSSARANGPGGRMFRILGGLQGRDGMQNSWPGGREFPARP